MKRTLLFSALVPLLAWAGARFSGPEDESVFVTGLRAGQHESLLYVWTSDADAKDPDFLSVIDADPKSPSYAKVIATAPTGSTADNEAHHFGYTVNTAPTPAGARWRRRRWATRGRWGTGSPARGCRSSTARRCRSRSAGCTAPARAAGSSTAPGRARSGTGRTRAASSGLRA